METTLNEILKHNPCSQYSDKAGWGLLLKNLDKKEADDEPLSLKYILESNGIEDAIWALRCFDYRDYCLFLADVAEGVLPIFEKQNREDKRPRRAVEAIRLFHQGAISKGDLKKAADASSSSSSSASSSASAASAAADADASSSDAFYVSYASASAAASASDASDAFYVSASAAASSASAAASSARVSKWEEIEQLFIKYFC